MGSEAAWRGTGKMSAGLISITGQAGDEAACFAAPLPAGPRAGDANLGRCASDSFHKLAAGPSGRGRSLAENRAHPLAQMEQPVEQAAHSLYGSAGPARADTFRAPPRRKPVRMRVAGILRCSLLSAALSGCLAVGTAAAQDSVVVQKSSPWDVFKFGFSAYKNGHKDQAVQAYRDASEQGQIGATWKLARMYAEGDGVVRDDYEAYKFFSEIVSRDVEPGSSDERFVGDALAEMGRYVQDGIPGSPVAADPDAAREYFQRAANYGSPIGQFEVGKMYLQRAESSPSKLRMAGRWLKLAAKNGHEGARAMLGNLLFQSGKVVDGLAMMTAALERAEPGDRPWIRSMQEEAFAATEESERRKAIDRADQFMLADPQ